jgi:hypothetical protein
MFYGEREAEKQCTYMYTGNKKDNEKGIKNRLNKFPIKKGLPMVKVGIF